MSVKKLTYLFSIISAGCLTASITAYAAGNSASFSGCEMENSYIRLSVEQDKNDGEYLRYKLRTTDGQVGNDEDNNRDLAYKYFYSGITSLRINDSDYIYGQGETVSEPAFNTEEKCHTSSQRFGNVVVEQKLTFSEGFTKGFEDMLKISYKVLETGENDNANIGVDVVIDPMIGDDDKVSFTANDAKIVNEAYFVENIPSEWKAEMNENSAVAAYGKVKDVPAVPDVLSFGNWNNMYDGLWNYSADISKPVEDGAVSVKWEPKEVKQGQEFVTYYGIRNSAAVENGNSVKLVNSPKTSDSFPKAAAALLAASVVSAAASLMIHRKEKADVK